MSDVKATIRTAIGNLLNDYAESHLPSDILRALQEEAQLMKETEEIKDAITSDPFENLKSLPQKALGRFQQMLRVVVCDRQRCGVDHARTHAVVSFGDDMNLTFLYERMPRRGSLPGKNGHCPCQVSYTIDLSKGSGQRHRLLEVNVWAATNVPSPEPALAIQGDVDDAWSDIGSDVEGENEENTKESASDSPEHMQVKKKARTGSEAGVDADVDPKQMRNGNDVGQDDNEDDNRDHYAAFLDPDTLENFVESANLQPADDGTAFFLLMTFPFYEHEWDIVGYVLETTFGGESDDESEEEQ